MLNGRQQQLANADKMKIHSYLSGFGSVFYDRIDNEMKPYQRDSIIKAGAFKTLTIEAGNNHLQAQLFRKPVSVTTRSQYDETTGKIWTYDLDKFYLIQAGDTTWYRCQYFQYDRLLKTPRYFLPSLKGK